MMLLLVLDDEQIDRAVTTIAAFLQVYREEADYNERTSVWCAAVGMGYIRDRVLEDKASRADLVARMYKGLAFCEDPWRLAAQKTKKGDPDALREYASIDSSGMSQGSPLLTSRGAS